MAITERQISIRAYSDSDEPSIRRAAEEQYYDKFSEFSKADIQIIMLGERIVGWFYCFVPDNSIYHGQIFIFVFPEYRRKGIGALVYHRAVKRFLSVGCGWWTSYPASQSADLFVGALGFGRLSTNIYLEHESMTVGYIRVVRTESECAARMIIPLHLTYGHANTPLCMRA